MTKGSCKYRAMTLSLDSRHVGHVTIFTYMLTTVCCLAGLGLGLGQD